MKRGSLFSNDVAFEDRLILEEEDLVKKVAAIKTLGLKIALTSDQASNCNEIARTIFEVQAAGKNSSLLEAIKEDWVQLYAVALMVETEANMRSKFTDIPIPGDKITMNTEALRSFSYNERERLLAKLY